LQDKVRDLELALTELEAVSISRIEEVVEVTAKEIASVKAERDALKTTLSSSNADIIMADHLRRQLADYESVKELCIHEVSTLQSQVRMLTETNQVLRVNLEKTRRRESSMEEQLLVSVFDRNATAAAAVVGGSIDKEALPATAASSLISECADRSVPTDEMIVGNNNEERRVDSVAVAELVVKQSQERILDLERELVDARSNVDDLILEIETVANDESKARHQCFDLLKQISEYQAMQRIALEENLHLQDSIDDLKSSSKDIETK
jgi:regulator of replication initiation timing